MTSARHPRRTSLPPGSARASPLAPRVRRARARGGAARASDQDSARATSPAVRRVARSRAGRRRSRRRARARPRARRTSRRGASGTPRNSLCGASGGAGTWRAREESAERRRGALAVEPGAGERGRAREVRHDRPPPRVARDPERPRGPGPGRGAGGRVRARGASAARPPGPRRPSRGAAAGRAARRPGATGSCPTPRRRSRRGRGGRGAGRRRGPATSAASTSCSAGGIRTAPPYGAARSKTATRGRRRRNCETCAPMEEWGGTDWQWAGGLDDDVGPIAWHSAPSRRSVPSWLRGTPRSPRTRSSPS